MAGARKTTDLSDLLATLQHAFAKPQLLQDALTHPSVTSARRKTATPYERMEFLGDRVLGLVIAEWLYERFPEATEGEMAKRHAAMVNGDTLRALATDLRLGEYLKLARGENTQAARTNLATLPDAMEAVIGALYLDGGMKAAKKFIRQLWQKEIALAEAPDDPKTALQEWVQGKGLPLPVYRVVEHSGPAHAPRFVIEVSVKSLASERAEGDSKRAAEKAAAAQLLIQTKTKK